ncbi:hypothetical protein [Streptomyces enissocaesilis]|uniref:Uncharacterized protein n=1 Tax=Streptomyces enissocaesilis TaxID=332589 RepID=A0ABN3XE28_9ACTN
MLFHLLWSHEPTVDVSVPLHGGSLVSPGAEPVTAGRGSVLRPGDWGHLHDGEHQVVALAGTAVRLRSAAGMDSVVLASYLVAAPDFAVTGEEPLPGIEPFGLLETLPEPARAAAVE